MLSGLIADRTGAFSAARCAVERRLSRRSRDLRHDRQCEALANRASMRMRRSARRPCSFRHESRQSRLRLPPDIRSAKCCGLKPMPGSGWQLSMREACWRYRNCRSRAPFAGSDKKLRNLRLLIGRERSHALRGLHRRAGALVDILPGITLIIDLRGACTGGAGDRLRSRSCRRKRRRSTCPSSLPSPPAPGLGRCADDRSCGNQRTGQCGCCDSVLAHEIRSIS